MGDPCKSNADGLLRLTGHLPKIINIATGAGFSIYKARLQEAIGVKNFISSINQEKGKAVHKLHGLAPLEIFSINSQCYKTVVTRICMIYIKRYY
jgi:hypothetical protein